MRFVLLCMLVVAMARVTPGVAQVADVTEQAVRLPVTIGGQDEALETLIVRPSSAGRYPIALIVNGSSASPKDARAIWLAHLAHDFAHRGWLAAVVLWRGYGTSTGAVLNNAGSCTAPDPAGYVRAHAADLAAALSTLRTRPDVDPTVTIGVGVSIGGVSMLDLAAENEQPFTAVINISGGVWHDAAPFAPNPACGPFEDALVRAVGAMGGAGVPTLWLYALNDPWFPPTIVRRMEAAYRAGGGKADLWMLPPFETDGHTLYRWEANALTQPLIDQFLRANGLPALADDRALLPIRATLPPDDAQLLDYYLRMPSEKAIALSDRGGLYAVYTQRSIEAARQQALERCRAISRTTCELAAENMTPMGRWKIPANNPVGP